MKNATYKVVSLMGFTKDQVRSQIGTAVAYQIVNEVYSVIKPTHIEVATPADGSISGQSAQTVRQYYSMWCDYIHQAGAGVCHRPTYTDFEGLYDVSKKVGTARIPIGLVSEAATDGTATWGGRWYEFCDTMASSFHTNDIVGCFPEATGHGILAGDSSSFVGTPHQSNYVTFFDTIGSITTERMSAQGKTINFFPAQNYSECNSGWINSSFFTAINAVPIDHYGITHTHQEMRDDLDNLYTAKGKVLQLHEWGDYWNNTLDNYQRMYYLNVMYGDVFTTRINNSKMNYFGYWRAASNSLEGILYHDGSNYRVNGRGKLLAKHFREDGVGRLPVMDSNGRY